MNTVVTPGLFSQVDASVSKKTPYLMAAFAVFVLVAFGVAGKTEAVAFQWSKNDDLFRLPDFVVASNVVGLVLGTILVAVAIVSFMLAQRKRVTPLWLTLIFGLLAVVALLAWLAAGNPLPFAFILGNAVVLAVPLALGAMGGIMSERVGVVNIAIEGQLLTGAFLAAVVGSSSRWSAPHCCQWF
jgi:simple sugar transport system permease protein